MRFVFLFGIILFSNIFYAQENTFEWGKSVSGAMGNSVVSDADGNIISTGSFHNNGFLADFDPSPQGISTIGVEGDSGLYIQKLDSEGNLLWVKGIIINLLSAFPIDAGIDADNTGNIYVGGTFKGSADFDPGPGVHNMSSSPSSYGFYKYGVFMLKLDVYGNFIWAHSIVSAGDSSFGGLAIQNDHIFVTGWSRRTARLSSDPDEDLFPSNIGDIYIWGVPIFILKLDTDAGLIWKKALGTSHSAGYFDNSKSSSIAVDQNENVYITGDFKIGLNCNLYTGVYPNSSDEHYLASSSGSKKNIFVCKLDSSGDFVWAFDLSSEENDYGRGIAVSDNGDVVITGEGVSDIDFDPSSGVHIANLGVKGVFTLKVDINMNFQWVSTIHYSNSTDVDIDESGYIYTTGRNWVEVDANPGEGFYNLVEGGFIQKLNESGEFVWAHSSGIECTVCRPEDIYIDTSGFIYQTGTASANGDLDTTSNVFNPIMSGMYASKSNPNSPLNINDIIFNSKINLYPNPTYDNVFINKPNGLVIENLKIFNNLGQILFESNIDLTSFNLANFSAGLYIIRLKTSQGIISLRLIKQ